MLVFLSALSGLLLSIPFLSPQHYGLTWIGFIPLLIAIEKANLIRSYLLGAVTGLIFSINISYWMIDFLILSKGYGILLSTVFSAIFWLYCAQLFAFITLSFNAIRQRMNVHEYLLFPLIVVSVFTLYPMIFSAHLGESQSQFLIAIQAIEFVGVYGLDTLIALANIVIFRLLWRFITVQPAPADQKKNSPRQWPLGIALLVLISWFYYGWSANQVWESKIDQWDTVRIGLVQPNETPSLEKQILYPGYSRAFPPEMAMTQRLASSGAEIVIWPEAKYKAYFDQALVSEAYQHHIKALNIRLIFQDIDRSQNSTNTTVKQQYNSAVMLSEQGELIGQYQKMKRIAFGEYVPFASDIPILKRWVEGFFGSFLNEMEKGESHQVFSSKLTNNLVKNNTFNIVPLICYETIFPEFVAEAVADALTKVPNTDLLVALSSDGWFGPTHQPYQHVNASILRAVENRLPLVHVLNNGPSIVAMPNGKIFLKTTANQADGYIVDVPYQADAKGSFFSHYPRLFIYSVYGLMLLILLIGMLKARKKTPQPTVLISARNESLN
ncbi:MAG: apolipoprotein N-acyltransferase [Oleispira sp.]|jgi:apolipoprotein N-acyltransferase